MRSIKRKLKVPTGDICIMQGEKNKDLEFVSLGDYGKEKNIKASFLGLHEEINGVPHGDLMPLEEKWVITISTQYGCSMGCLFCDVPKVGIGINVTKNDLTNQVIEAIKLHPEILATKRLNIHYARMGEPTWNAAVLEHVRVVRKEIYPFLNRSLIHPVVSTMLPKKNKYLMKFLQDWCEVKNYNFKGDAGLQFSINSTSDSQREKMFSGSSLSLKEISTIGEYLPDPVGRKYTLNFALADDYKIDASTLLSFFDPKKFIVKVTPLHDTKACSDNHITTTDGYNTFSPYKDVEENLKSVGFDVLVFIPSHEEDLGRITCGNAILSGSIPAVAYQEISYP